jgi:hypothetical protein
VYGGTDFSVFRGVVDAFLKRRRAWIPTNGVSPSAADPVLFAEAVFGLALLIVPLAKLPELLYLPCWFLFAGKFLFGPALSLLYQDEVRDALDVETLVFRPAGDADAGVRGAGQRAVVEHLVTR